MTHYLAKTVCILVAGKAGVGKSTCSKFMEEYLKEEGYRVYLGHFANGVKAVAQRMGWDGIKDEKGRRLLQQIGGVGREYDNDMWCKELFQMTLVSSQYPLDIVIVDDWRFPNELEFLKTIETWNVVTLRVNSPEREILKGTPEANDSSETSLPSDNDSGIYDYFFENNEDDLEKCRNFCYLLAEKILNESPKWKEENKE
jgi:hypothetical protein